jgi:hypothetical protein
MGESQNRHDSILVDADPGCVQLPECAWSLSVGYIKAAGGAVASAGKSTRKSENETILTMAPRQERFH